MDNEEIYEGVVIDANVMCRFVEQEFNREGELLELIEFLSDNFKLVLTDHIKQEWTDTCRPSQLNKWLQAKYKHDKITDIDKPTRIHQQHISKLKELGFLPAAQKDLKYINCANQTDQKYILSEDIDFYAPTKKQGKNREKIISERSGPVCRHLEQKMGILVGDENHCRDEFNRRFEKLSSE
jgi:hypothetical protein